MVHHGCRYRRCCAAHTATIRLPPTRGRPFTRCRYMSPLYITDRRQYMILMLFFLYESVTLKRRLISRRYSAGRLPFYFTPSSFLRLLLSHADMMRLAARRHAFHIYVSAAVTPAQRRLPWYAVAAFMLTYREYGELAMSGVFTNRYFARIESMPAFALYTLHISYAIFHCLPPRQSRHYAPRRHWAAIEMLIERC